MNAVVSSGAPGSERASGPPWRLLAVAALVLTVALGFGGRLWWHAKHFADTDNAFVSGHVLPVSTRVAGVVVDIAVQDNQTVRRGDVLLRLDAADAEVQIERLTAQIAQADAAVAGAAAQIEQSLAQAAAARAQVLQAQATLARAELDAARNLRLFSGELRAVSQQEVDASNAAKSVAQAELSARRAAAAAAEQAIRSVKAGRESAIAQRSVLAAQRKEAQLQLSYVQLLAPADGRVGKRTVELGQRVQPGQQLLAVVDSTVWITANFKETQVAQMQRGQSATVELDAFPGQPLRAKVESFAPASGATFSLLPPDNATGNFTKIVQRVPVKLVFDEPTPGAAGDLRARLVPGMSANVSVDLTPVAGP